MDEVEKVETTKPISSADILYDMREAMIDHHITLNQAMYLFCRMHNIDFIVEPSDIVSLVNKELLKAKGTVNITKLLHLQRNTQMTLDLNFNSKPKGTEITLDRAERIEKTFVVDEDYTEEDKKKIADRYFKGDLVLTKYFIIFKSLFPVPSTTKNRKWNKKFGFTYTGISLWDDDLRVGKKFIEIYKKLDIGIFLEATYRKVKESIDMEQEKCFMTKPYKHLLSFESYYRDVEKSLENRQIRSEEDTALKVDKLKV
jgi:hypothetical protein